MERLIMGMEREEMEVRAEVDRLSAGTEMQELAGELCEGIDNICGGFHYYKDENVLGEPKTWQGKSASSAAIFCRGIYLVWKMRNIWISRHISWVY